MSAESIANLRSQLEAVRIEQGQFEQPVNRQITHGSQVFYVAHDSDIDALLARYLETGPTDYPIGPFHKAVAEG